MTALRALAAGLAALVLVLPSASASSTTVTDDSGDATDAFGNYAAHLDVLQGDLGSSSGTVTMTLTLADLDASQGASYYSFRLASGGIEVLPFCSLEGDGTGLSGTCGIRVYHLGLQDQEAALRAAPLGLGGLLALVLDSFLWQDAEQVTGTQADAPMTATYSVADDTITWTAQASDLGLEAGDVVELLYGGASDCTAGCATADNIFGNGASFTVE